MLLAMLSSTFMLVAIMKYDVKAKDRHYPSFQRFWASRCDIGGVSVADMRTVSIALCRVDTDVEEGCIYEEVCTVSALGGCLIERLLTGSS